ncbi:ribonuclease H2, subunit C [Cubamyces menziesii]|nr:ribonuclease H2, subunit C [Cubamyces menziesii]
MSSTPTVLKINTHDGPLPSATPHLMPFHIAYSGPAPISTYFRVRSAPEPTYGRDAKLSSTNTNDTEGHNALDSQTTVVADTQVDTPNSSLLPSASSSTLVASHTDISDQAYTSSLHPESRHFTASFRGRSMHGLRVPLPEGYAGLVLRAPYSHKGKGAAPARGNGEESHKRPKSKTSGRATRRAKQARDEVEADEEDREPDAPMETLDERPARTLQPTAEFNSFVLWHPDIPVDEGRDDYLRSLTEWTKLAAEIHKVEDC